MANFGSPVDLQRFKQLSCTNKPKQGNAHARDQ